MLSFSPSRLALARHRRGITKKALSESVAISTTSLVAYETGKQKPGEATLARLAEELKFPKDFFYGRDLDEFPSARTNFRALTKMTSKQRNQATAAGELAFYFADWIETKFSIPSSEVPKLQNTEPDVAAEIVRAEWGIGEKSISNLVHVLESKGVWVFSLVEECKEVDAFSCWRHNPRTEKDTPFIFLNTMKSPEHSRMDAAHELGHLILHWKHDTPRGGRDLEREANYFASAFLMPTSSIKAKAPHVATLDQVIDAKRLWGVSVAALVFRMHKVGMLTDWQYHALFVELSSKGYRKDEPKAMNPESSQILNKIFKALRNQGISRADIAQELSLPIEELNKLVFGLALTGV